MLWYYGKCILFILSCDTHLDLSPWGDLLLCPTTVLPTDFFIKNVWIFRKTKFWIPHTFSFLQKSAKTRIQKKQKYAKTRICKNKNLRKQEFAKTRIQRYDTNGTTPFSSAPLLFSHQIYSLSFGFHHEWWSQEYEYKNIRRTSMSPRVPCFILAALLNSIKCSNLFWHIVKCSNLFWCIVKWQNVFRVGCLLLLLTDLR